MRRFDIAFLALAAWLGPALSAQQGQPRTVDCNAPDSAADPRCAARWNAPAESGAAGTGVLPRIPVIRDLSQTAYPDSRIPREDSAGPAPASQLRHQPEKPTEFQTFVEQSVGSLLPIFGADLFREAPSTFAPADRAAVTPDYVVGPGDELLVRAWGPIDLNVSPTVDREGAIYIPQIGAQLVAGLPLAQVQEVLKTAIGRVYRNFYLSVNLGQLRSIQVFVLGQARQPGAYTVSSLSTLVNAVFVSGGPNSHGSLRRIRLTRGSGVACEFDLYDLLQRGDKSKDQRLLPGDVIFIPPVGPQVAIAGSVQNPGIYELAGSATLEEAVRLAGGLSPVAARRNAIVERVENSARRVLEAPLEGPEAAGTKLQDGDVVRVLEAPPRFENAVTLRGNVADPARVPWRLGMRIRDLIPDREALLTRDYWAARNRLTPRADDALLPEMELRGSPAYTELADLRRPATDPRSGLDSSDGQKRAAVFAPTGREERAGPRSGPASIAASRTEDAPVRNRVERSALEINWSYAVIERRDPKDLSTSLIPFSLHKAVIDRDETENLPLEPGDVVTIFSTTDVKLPQNQQTRYVRLEGEFVAAGVYSVKPGETLRQLVTREGGLTPQAYLFGSQFTRRSAQLEQQQRLEDLVNSLEREVASSSANLRGSVLSPEEAAAANSEIAGQRDLVEKMRQVRASGRIVLELDPRDPKASNLPDMALEDGDVFSVPSRPSFVNVIGSVYNGTSFLYSGSRRVGDYLSEAGGATRTADSRRTFLIRADGSITSKSRSTRLFAGSFDDLRLHPGDTVVVPERIGKATFLKGLKDWAQVFAQFGLGVAAINILR